MARILVVDDDRSLRRLIKHLLCSAGHEVVSSSNGKRALTVLEDNDDFDLVITDVRMPEMDGREFVMTLLASDELKAPPIIIMSAFVKQREVQDLLEAGAERFVAKPVKKDQLLEYVQKLTAQETTSA